jgi:hypothetical protein
LKFGRYFKGRSTALPGAMPLSRDERQCHEMGHIRHRSLLARIDVKSSACTGV